MSLPDPILRLIGTRHPGADLETAVRLSRQHDAAYLESCAIEADKNAVSYAESADGYANADDLDNARMDDRAARNESTRAATLRAAADLIGLAPEADPEACDARAAPEDNDVPAHELFADRALRLYRNCPADERAQRWADYTRALRRFGYLTPDAPDAPETEGCWVGPDCAGNAT